ncbi:uncharacterized protein [Palaemon carinicauda]|uniref:uncharacterized protein n=1 Tax=Palaemon carinicauda TaxID=392227 RepID=UPI0035B63E82
MQQVNMPNSFLDLTLCAVLPQAGNNIAKAAWSQDKKVRVGGGPRFRRLIPNQESYGCYNRFTSLPSPDLVEEDVALSNHEQVPDRSPKRRKREYTQDQISNVPVKSERGRQQELDYNKIGEVLRKRVKTDSQNELHSEGPYGKAAEELAWGNNKRRRKQLYTIWHHNRGNVQVQPNCIETSQSSIPDSEDQSMDDHVVYANLEQVLPTKKREKDGQRQKYCICNMPWRSIDNIMVECEKCQQWYHCSCLGLPPCPNSKAVAIFTCGQNSCSSTELKLVFSPRSENLSCKNKIRQTLKESETEKELFRDIKFPKVRHSTGQPDSTNANQKQAQLPRVQRRNHKRKSIQAVVTTQPGKTRPETTWPVTTRSGTAQPVITFSETTRTVTTQPLITHSETARPVTTQPVTTLLESTPMETTLLESTPMETTLADLTSPVITPPVTTPAVTTPLHTRTIIKQMQRISSIVDSAADTCRRVKIFNEQHMETFTELMISLDKTVEKLDSVDSFGLDTIQNQKKQNIQMFQKFLGDFEKNKSDTSENCEKCVKEYNSVSTSEDSSDDNLDFPPLDNSVLESILQRKIPKHFFECTLPEKAEFVLDAKDWKNVCDTQEGKGFARGEWQHIMASGIKESNKHCVFMFEGHYVSMAKKRKMKKNAVFFKTSAICKFEDCPVVVNVTVHEKDSFNVLVEYTGHVKHHVTHMHARPVSGKERRDIKKKMEHGLKAWPLYTEKVRDGDKDLIISGNVNGIGKDSRILNQIAR